MKIGLDTAPAALRGTYFQHLASVLARYAPEHEYIIGAEVNDGVDLYHGFRSSLPLSVHLRRVPSVMTVPNLNFLRYPHLYTFAERLFVLTLYRRALRRAGRVITVSAPARRGAVGTPQYRPFEDRGHGAAGGSGSARKSISSGT